MQSKSLNDLKHRLIARTTEVNGQSSSRPFSPIRPRILFFSQNACWPLNTGARIRNYHLLHALAQKGSVTWFGFADHENDSTFAGTPERQCDLSSICASVNRVKAPPPYTIPKMIRGIIGPDPLMALKYATDAMEAALRRVLQEQDFDAVQVESTILAPYLPIIRAAKSRPLVICDWHNIESEVLARYSAQSPSLAKQLYANITTRHMVSLERRSLPAFDAHLVVSERDRSQLLEWEPKAPVFVIENGVDREYYSIDEMNSAWRAWLQGSNSIEGRVLEGTNSEFDSMPGDPHRHRVLFVASMDYYPNVDAMIYFAESIWPRIFARRPDIKLTIVGREPAPRIRTLASSPGIEVTGTVEDVRPYYREALACVVPLRIGGGSRVKILEAMAAGVPIISAGLGAEGLAIADGEHLLIADTTDQFYSALDGLLDHQDLQQRLIAAGHGLIRERYDWSTIGIALQAAYKELGVRLNASVAV